MAFEGVDWIRLDQIGSDRIRLDQNGSDWIRLDRLDQIGSYLRMTLGLHEDDLGISRSTLDTLAACFTPFFTAANIVEWLILQRG